MGGGGGGGKRLRKAIDLLLPTASVPWRRPCVGFVKKEFAASFLDSERLGGGVLGRDAAEIRCDKSEKSD